MGRRRSQQLRIIEGNLGHRPLNPHEPQLAVGEPDMSAHLNRDARREWRWLVPILLAMRVLTAADGAQLTDLCIALTTLSKAQQQLDKSGLLIKTPQGFVQANPLLKIVAVQTEIIGRIAREFGLSPASRTRIQAQADNSFDAIGEAMCG